MAKYAMLVAIFASCIMLVLVSQAEAQRCKQINTVSLLNCRTNLKTGQCARNSACYNALAVYRNEPNPCVCKLLQTAVSAGFQKNKIIGLLNNCKFGRTFPRC